MNRKVYVISEKNSSIDDTSTKRYDNNIKKMGRKLPFYQFIENDISGDIRFLLIHFLNEANAGCRNGRVQRFSKSKSVIIEDDLYDDTLPSLHDCISGFLSLVEKASQKSVDLLPNLDELTGFERYREHIMNDARDIFLLYLSRYDEASNSYMLKFPKLGISLRD